MAHVLRIVLLVAVLATAGAAAAAPLSGDAAVPEVFSLRDGTLLAGRIAATANASAGMVAVGDVDLAVADGATVVVCPDRAGGSVADRFDEARGADCPDGKRYEKARLDVLRGGVTISHEVARAHASSVGYAAPFADPDASVQGMRVPTGLLLTGDVRVEVDAFTFAFRLIGEDATVRVRGVTTFPERHTGENFTVYVTGAPGGYTLAAPGAALATSAWSGSVTPAPHAEAEAGFDRAGLLALQRALLPADRVDRPLDLAYASGPFELVPAALNGMLAFRGNVTLNGETATAGREAIVLGGVHADVTWQAGANLTFQGDARWLYRAGSLATGTGGATGSRVVAGLFGSLALVGGVLEVRGRWRGRTPPEPRVWQRRMGIGFVVTVAAAVALARVTTLFDAPLLTQWDSLHARTRAQLGLLAAVVAAWAAAVGAPGPWLVARNLLPAGSRWRAPVLAFLAAAGTSILLAVAFPVLVTWAMRIVRL